MGRDWNTSHPVCVAVPNFVVLWQNIFRTAGVPPTWDQDTADPKHDPPPRELPTEDDRYGSSDTTVHSEIRRVIGLLAYRLSRSLKVIEVTRIARLPMTSYISDPYGPISYSFRDKRLQRLKKKTNKFFLPSCIWHPQRRWFSLEFYNTWRA